MHTIHLIYENILNIQNKASITILGKLNESLTKVHFFSCIYRTLNLHKHPHSRDYNNLGKF